MVALRCPATPAAFPRLPGAVHCSLEQWNGTDRHHFNAVVTDQDEADTYLPAFQSAVEVARVSSIMCS